MKKYLGPAREIDVSGEYDVIVVGGGPAGLATAIASGRNKAKTLLIEQLGYLGGTATASLMINLNGFRNQVEPDSVQTVKGIAQEIILELHKLDGLGKSPYKQKEYDIEKGELSYSYCVDPEKFKYVTLKMVHEAGVDMLFHTYFCDAIMEDNELKGVIVENKSGRYYRNLGKELRHRCSGGLDLSRIFPIEVGLPKACFLYENSIGWKVN